MSLLKKLFGIGGASESAGAAPASQMEHEGYTISATPQKEGGQFRLHGIISKEVGGEEMSHTLIRADLFQSKEDCVAATFRKAQQVIKEQGDRIFK